MTSRPAFHRFRLFFAALAAIALPVFAQATVENAQLAGLLAEAELELRPIPGTVPGAPGSGALLAYEHSAEDPENRLQVRYVIRPIGRVTIDYEDPHNSAPDPNHLFPLMFQSIVGQLSGGGHSPTREYPPTQAAELFRADWAAAAVFAVVEEYGSGYGEALIIAMHKNHVADAYTIFLYNDYPAVKDKIRSNLRTLRFMSRPQAAAESQLR